MLVKLACLAAAAAACTIGVSAHAVEAANLTWSGHFPKTGSVTIPAGDSVTLDTDVALSDLTINGTLLCGSGARYLSANWIAVHGALQCGTRLQPHADKLTITLKGAASDQDVMSMGTKFLGAMGGGRIELAGQDRRGWTRLTATARRGASKITLEDASSWHAGDSIVIVSTDFDFEHAEERRIASRAGNTLTLSAPLGYEHWCSAESFGPHSLNECAEVGLLTRNIVIRGDAPSATSKFGGHVMAMSGSSLRLSGVELRNMGQKGRLARYPVHWHLAGNRAGDYLENSSIVHSFNRFLSVHGTHNVRVAGNVGYDTIGHGYYLEDGIEHGNVFENNLGAVVRNATDGLPTPSDRSASVFWVSNPDNTFRGNVAAGSEHTGFWLGFPEHPIGLSATTAVWPRRTPLRLFKDNTSHSNEGRGLYVDGAENPDRTTSVTWYEPRQDPADGNSPKVPPVFENFTAYKNRFEGVWLRSFSNPVLEAAKLADNSMGAYFASLSGTPGRIRNSLVVGETGNKGNPDSWQVKGADGRELPLYWEPGASIQGLEFYDGPMAIEDTLFANFVSNSQRKSGAITNLAPNPYWVSSQSFTQGVSFRNANRVWLDPISKSNIGDAFSIIRDVDGSITGVPDQRIVPKTSVLVTPSCALRPLWNAYVCPHNYVGVQVSAYDGSNLGGTILRRGDGAAYTFYGNPNTDRSNLHFSVLENRPYTLNLPSSPPKRLAFTRYEKAGRAARISLFYPASNFTVTLWGSPVKKAASIGDLSSGGTSYYYDSVRQMLHLRLVTSTGNWEIYEVRRP